MLLTTFGNRPKKLDSIHQTDFHQEEGGHETNGTLHQSNGHHKEFHSTSVLTIHSEHMFPQPTQTLRHIKDFACL